MTEQEWLSSPDPAAMLAALPRALSARKFRLFDCACWRLRAAFFMKSGGTRLLAAIDHAEGLADGVVRRVRAEFRTYGVCGKNSREEARTTIALLASRPRLGVPAPTLCLLLREVFGNPFAAAVDLAPWRGGEVGRLAQGIYAERAFDRMPILGDALEEAGCTSAEALEHYRQPGEHFRGCWALDAALGKT